MTFRLGNVVVIAPESRQQCDECGKVAELRPYGPGGKCICHPCAMKPENASIARENLNRFFDGLPPI